MKERRIYFLFTDTGTNLARMINFFTKQKFNHVSISFTKDFQTVYSFGRKRADNPFIGGFVHEDIKSGFLANANCCIYYQKISENDYQRMMDKIKVIEARQDEYRFNFLGLLGVLFRIKIKRKSAYFCSQFAATIIEQSEHLKLDKPACFVTPGDIRALPGNELIYQGILRNYQPESVDIDSSRLVLGNRTTNKQSFIYYLSNKFKKMVIK